MSIFDQLEAQQSPANRIKVGMTLHLAIGSMIEIKFEDRPNPDIIAWLRNDVANGRPIASSCIVDWGSSELVIADGWNAGTIAETIATHLETMLNCNVKRAVKRQQYVSTFAGWNQ